MKTCASGCANVMMPEEADTAKCKLQSMSYRETNFLIIGHNSPHAYGATTLELCRSSTTSLFPAAHEPLPSLVMHTITKETMTAA